MENLLKDVKHLLLSIVQKNLKDPEEIESKTSKNVKIFLDKLSKSSKVCIPTNKSNKHLLVKLDDYKSMINQHLLKDAIEILRSKVVDLYEASKELLDDIELELNENEFKMIHEIIKTRGPKPKLLIKDQKDPNPDGTPKTRFLI